MSLDQLEMILISLHITGPDGSHTRANNLESIARLVANDKYETYGIRKVEDTIRNSSYLTEVKVLEMISDITRCSKDICFTEGLGFISPSSTLKGIRETAMKIAEIIRTKGTFVFGTGHPGCLISCYQVIADMVKEHGCKVVNAAGGIHIEGSDVVDYVGDVAVVTNGSGVVHTHSNRFMTRILETWNGKVDLAIVDHGFFGGTANYGISSIVFFDTNDPVVPVTKDLGLDVLLLPLNDNRPNIALVEVGMALRNLTSQYLESMITA